MGSETVIDVTERFRRDRWLGANEWTIVSDDGFGNPIGLAEDGAMWTFDHDAGTFSRVADSFEDFIRGLLDEGT